MKRYKQNLRIIGNQVISYATHVATIDQEKGLLYEHGYWSKTTRKHVYYVARELNLKVVQTY